MQIPLHIADAICKMEEVCDGEGQGPPEACELMVWIANEYPELVDKYSHLPWGYYVKQFVKLSRNKFPEETKH